jgi:glycosyltransferase involved in cell wall biosynthesis
MLTIVVPVYRNEASIPDLVHALEGLVRKVADGCEVVFVDDGSPDRSRLLLEDCLPASHLRARLVVLSRNYGSFAAIRAGLAAGTGDRFAVLAADLQDPPDLALRFSELLASGICDVVVGTRTGRVDPLPSRLASALFWWAYRHFVQREVPPGGVDVFGCTRRFRDEILALEERNTTLVGLIFWLGFRREELRYQRQPRRHGRSAWSLRRKLRYLLDSTFAFSDLPIRLLWMAGLVGMATSVGLATVVLVARLAGTVEVPGYTATVLTVMFFGGLNSFGMGVLGEYLWRTFENTKRRPGWVVTRMLEYPRSEE